MARKVRLFDRDVAPACEYCEFGRNSSEYDMVMCSKRGIVSPYFRCISFRYNPMRRVPKREDYFKKKYHPAEK